MKSLPKKILKVLIVMVNHNSYGDTLKVSNYIKNHLILDGMEISIFVLDNSDEKKGKKNFIYQFSKLGKVTFEDHKQSLIGSGNIFVDSENFGFAAGVNQGIRHAVVNRFDLVWLLNTDVVLSPNALIALIPYVSDFDSILGSVVEEWCGYKKVTQLGTLGLSNFKGYSEVKRVEGQPIIKVDAVAGTSMLIGKKVFSKLKFNEVYFMYVEENDYCFRAANEGFYSYTVMDSVIHHSPGKTWGGDGIRKWQYKVRNLLYFKKIQGDWRRCILIPYLFLVTIRQYRFDLSYITAYFKGIKRYLRNDMGK